MKKMVQQNLFIGEWGLKKFVLLNIFLVSLSVSVVFAQGNASGVDKLDTPPPSGAPAGETKPKAQSKGKKTTIDFEDQLIEGSRQKPELFYLLQNKDFNYKRLIRLREDFLPELRKSGEDVKGRSGGGQ